MLLGQMTQAQFGALVGISQPAVSDLVRSGTLPAEATGDEWLLAYCHRLREQAAGRMGNEEGGLSLTGERAALAKAQREGIEIMNAVKRGQYAPITLLSEVLAMASQSVAERFEHLPGQLRKACPDLPAIAIDQVMSTVASARNEWVRQTVALVTAKVTSEDDEDAELQALHDESAAD
jgi:phage terminase Nu1 subunit (DNA packaging protein)